MNVAPPSPESAAVPEAAEVRLPPVSPAEIDRSCRAPVGALFGGAACWLLFAILLGVISSIKMHGPGFLAHSPWLTFGRVRPAFMEALVFGFASQAALGTALWLLARLGRNVFQGPNATAIAAGFWNLGVLVGVFGILAGGGTGYELLEFPRSATPILFLSYLVIAICAGLTFHARRERELYPSQWFILAALLWFPWVYSTAQLLLVFGSVRGVLQEVVSGWAAHNLFSLWLTPLGLAALFYFLPKLVQRPLYSRSLAMFAFWLLAFFGAVGGISSGIPVPRWIPSLGVAFTVLTTVAVLAVAVNLYSTIAGATLPRKAEPSTRFFLLSARCFVLGSAFQILSSLQMVHAVTDLTLFDTGVKFLLLFGFVGMAVIGAIYYVLPRICDTPLPSPNWVNTHYLLAAWGVALAALPLLLGGWVQGTKMNNAAVNFIDLVRSTVPFLGLSTLGLLLLLAGAALLVANVCKLFCACCCACCFTSQGSGKTVKIIPGRRS